MARITNPAVEQVWIARLLDSCCACGYGPVAVSRAVRSLTESSGEPSDYRCKRAERRHRAPGKDRQLVGSSQR